jgi:flagellar biosynthesis chaperone FliJ
MGDFGVLASRYHANARLLREFDEALTFLKKQGNADKEKLTKQTQKLLMVLEPIKETIYKRLSNSLILDDSEVVGILHQRHLSEWQNYQALIRRIVQKLADTRTSFSKEEWEVLNDVADALDTRCTHLFKRMGER